MTIEFVVLDRAGLPQSWSWAQRTFGVRLRRAPVKTGPVFRLVRLVEAEGMQIKVRALDREGNGVRGAHVVRTWPAAPALQPFEAPASNWFERGVFGRTDLRGEAVLQLSPGEIAPAGQGAGALWLASELGPSDLLEGVAPLPGGARRHLDAVWALLDAAEVIQMAVPTPARISEAKVDIKTQAASEGTRQAEPARVNRKQAADEGESARAPALSELGARVAALEATLARMPNVEQLQRIAELDALNERVKALEGTLARAEAVQKVLNRVANLAIRVSELEAHNDRLAEALEALLKTLRGES